MVRTSLLFPCLLLAAPAVAQIPAPPDTSARRQAMERLHFMVGDWAGEAWAQVGPGPRHRLWQTETIRGKLGGQALLVEGVGRRLTDDGPADTVFNALAVIQWDPENGYTMRSTTLEGRTGEFTLELTDDGYVWGFEVPGGRVRYTMTLTSDGAWIERGEFLREGAPPFPIMEMRLRRVER